MGLSTANTDERDLLHIASTLVSYAVSVVHQCDSQCVLAEQETTSRVERELATQKKTVFVHNTDNNMYCYNIFCMHCLPYLSLFVVIVYHTDAGVV